MKQLKRQAPAVFKFILHAWKTMRKFFNEYHVFWVGNMVPHLNKNKAKSFALDLHVNERH